ncbi:kinase-like domain-containing protein [Gigaspora rosea]|uniref:Kinase-like domain-containing protein n=1 Tax=Gigaspora rosea TaxID=44941 RepID=A0A397VIG2_9GLOM|nr:kinase-like domain-containing protein [Gigaspora rosea]
MDKFVSKIKGDLKDFNHKDFQNFHDVSNISDEFCDIKYACLKINESHEFHVVLKYLNENNEDEYYNKFIREIENLRNIDDNENVIKFLGVTKDPSKNFYSLVLRYCGNKNLSDHLKEAPKKDWSNKIKMAKDIANGLNYIHSENIILYNLNSKNIMIDNDKLVISDFSLAVSLDSQKKPTAIKITEKNVAYVDPKNFTHANMANKSYDIYSLGVILWELSSGRPPFSKNKLNIEELKRSIELGKRELPVNLTPVDYKELYCDAWDRDYYKRPSIKEVISCLKDIEFDLEYHVYRDSGFIPKIFYQSNKSHEKACLKVIKGSSENEQYLFIPEGEIFIGRKNSNDIVIKDHEIDKRHAKIKNYQGKVNIIDLGSKSGIFINGEKLTFHTLYTLNINDIIKMGHSTFQYLPTGKPNFIDSLTQIYNAEYLQNNLANEFENSQNWCLLFCDFDNFKKINENYSRAAGDHVLAEFSKLIQNKYIYDKDIFARYGDDKFIILLIDAKLALAYEIAQEIRPSVDTYQFNHNEIKLQSITLSIGVSGMNSSVKNFNDLLDHAKKACKNAKEYGRNQIVIWENEPMTTDIVSIVIF